MEFSELILKRQSDRKYQDKPVARELIIKCIEAARVAPSACNSQPWTFVVVDEPVLCAEMASAAASIGRNNFVAQAPVIVAVVQERMNLSARIGCAIKDKEYSLLDIGIAVEHFCLQAAELGLGTCILGWFDEKKVRKLLGVKKRRIPLLISLGYSNCETRNKTRKPIDRMSCWNKYNKDE